MERLLRNKNTYGGTMYLMVLTDFLSANVYEKLNMYLTYKDKYTYNVNTDFEDLLLDTKIIYKRSISFHKPDHFMRGLSRLSDVDDFVNIITDSDEEVNIVIKHCYLEEYNSLWLDMLSYIDDKTYMSYKKMRFLKPSIICYTNSRYFHPNGKELLPLQINGVTYNFNKLLDLFYIIDAPVNTYFSLYDFNIKMIEKFNVSSSFKAIALGVVLQRNFYSDDFIDTFGVVQKDPIGYLDIIGFRISLDYKFMISIIPPEFLDTTLKMFNTFVPEVFTRIDNLTKKLNNLRLDPNPSLKFEIAITEELKSNDYLKVKPSDNAYKLKSLLEINKSLEVDDTLKMFNISREYLDFLISEYQFAKIVNNTIVSWEYW